MINLRYHIVSLIAVFLSLALGILIGTTVLEEGVVTLLEAERDQLAGHRDRLAEDNGELRDELDLWETFGRTIVPDLTAGRLSGRSVTLLVQFGAEDRFLDEILVALEHAGATVAGRIEFSDRWRLADDPTREQLALLLNAGDADGDALLEEAATQIGARLKTQADATAQSDLLASLARNGFISLEELRDEAFPPQGSLAVWIAAADGNAMPPRDEFVLPLLTAVQDQLPVVVAESLETRDPLSVEIRGNDVLGDAVSTVDHADTLLGELSLIVALNDADAGLLAHHYGVEEGAAAIIPPIR